MFRLCFVTGPFRSNVLDSSLADVVGTTADAHCGCETLPLQARLIPGFSLVQRVLDIATKDYDSPDVRDRAYICWLLLSTDPGAAKVWTRTVYSNFCERAKRVSIVGSARKQTGTNFTFEFRPRPSWEKHNGLSKSMIPPYCSLL